MDDLLFLCPSVPRPAVSGEPGRIWRMLRHLASRYRVHLGCFGEEDANRQTEGLFRQFCHSSYIARPTPQFKPAGRLSAALGFGGVGASRHPGLWAWAERVWRERSPGRALAVRSPLAAYVSMRPDIAAVRIVDHEELPLDPDDSRWGEPKGCFRGVRRWLQRGEARALLATDRHRAAEGEHLFPSPRLAARFRALVPWASARIHDLPDGIDLVHFSAQHALPNPSPHPGRTILFGVTLDDAHAANMAARFARSVLPRVRDGAPDIRFLVVGGRGPGADESLSDLPGVTLVPPADDMRPWLVHAQVVVFPLAAAARRSVIEAMAMARPVVASSAALADLDPMPGREVWRADGAADLAEAIGAALGPEAGAAAGKAARARVQADYSWEAMMERLDGLLDGRPVRGIVNSWPIASGLGR